MVNNSSYTFITRHNTIRIITHAPRRASRIASQFIAMFTVSCLALFLFPLMYGIFVPSPNNTIVAELPVRVFMIVWFILWIPIGIALFVLTFWIAKGREVITINADTFSIRREIMGFGVTKTYPVAQIRCLQITPANRRRLGKLSGAIGFAYQRQPVTWGMMLQEDDAKVVVEAILRRFPMFEKCSSEDIPD